MDELLEDFNKYEYEKIYKVGEYYVFYEYTGGGLDLNTIIIYNKSNKVYSNDNVKSEYWLGEPGINGQKVNIVPVSSNKVFHFVEQGDIDNNKLKYNTIDLSKDKIEVKLVKEFTGYYLGEK